MTRDEIWDHGLERCLLAVFRTSKPIPLFLSHDGVPTPRHTDAKEVGVYTQKVTMEQLREDMVEAECERVRRHG